LYLLRDDFARQGGFIETWDNPRETFIFEATPTPPTESANPTEQDTTAPVAQNPIAPVEQDTDTQVEPPVIITQENHNTQALQIIMVAIAVATAVIGIVCVVVNKRKVCCKKESAKNR